MDRFERDEQAVLKPLANQSYSCFGALPAAPSERRSLAAVDVHAGR